MAPSPAARSESPHLPLTEDGRKREALAALDAVLTTVEQQQRHVHVLNPWECFHFWAGLHALQAGNYKKAWTEAELALVPFAERTSNAKAKVQAAGSLDQCNIAMLKQALAVAKTEPPKS
jgi:hypothetical protein